MGRHGENIRKRADDRWEARYIQYYDKNGKAIYRYVYGKTYLEAKQKRNLEISKFAAGLRQRTSGVKITFNQLAEEWLFMKKAQVKQSTYANYSYIIQTHFLPELGKLYVSTLTTQSIEEFLQKKRLYGRKDGTGGLSDKTVSDFRSLLKLILKYAKKKGYFCPSNLDFYVPSGKSPKIEILQKEELDQLEKILLSEPKPIYLGILIALYGGLRIGEVCALQWKDFNFTEGTVQINKTLLRVIDTDQKSDKKTRVLIEPPKTEYSNRIIPLSDDILTYFYYSKSFPEDYILTGQQFYMEPRVCLEKYKKILKQAGIKDHTFHALRHTFATRCVELGFDVKSLSEIMGHSNISITMQRYVHPTLEQKRAQMNRLSINSFHGQTSGQTFK